MSTGKPTAKPPRPLQKPPGYKDPAVTIPKPRLPRKPVKLPVSLQQEERRSDFCRGFRCCCCVFLAVLIIVLASAGGVFCLWLQPHLPEIHLKSITSSKFNVRAAPEGPMLDAETAVGLEFKNLNQNLRIKYGRTHVALNALDGEVSLGELTVPGFTQDKNNITIFKLGTKVAKEVVDISSAEELKRGFRSKNLVVNAEIKSGIGVKGRGWSTGTVMVKVVCEGIRLIQVQDGRAMPKCRIKILNWIYIN